MTSKDCSILYNNVFYILWGFPKIEVPANLPFIDGLSLINHPFWGSICVSHPQQPSTRSGIHSDMFRYMNAWYDPRMIELPT